MNDRDSSAQPAMQSPASPPIVDDGIELEHLVRAIWRYRRAVLALGLLGGLIGLAVSLFTARYVADGLFLTPGLDMASYKRYEVALGNGERMRRFLELNQLESSQTAEVFHRIETVPGALAKAVRPAFTLTERDAKSYDVKGDGPGQLLGIQISVERKKQTAESPVQHFAEYLRHTMIELDLQESLMSQCLASQSRELELRNEQISGDFSLQQARMRAEHLRDIMKRVPDASRVDARQVVAIDAGRERFLSPTAQLVAVEVEIANAQLADQQRERERTATRLRKSFYCQARNLQQESGIGQELLGRLGTLQSAVFEGEDLASDIVEQVRNEIELTIQGWVNRYMQLSRFVVPPDGGEKLERKPGRGLGLVMGGVLGTFLGMLVAMMLAWWRDHRAEVFAAEDP